MRRSTVPSLDLQLEFPDRVDKKLGLGITKCLTLSLRILVMRVIGTFLVSFLNDKHLCFYLMLTLFVVN